MEPNNPNEEHPIQIWQVNNDRLTRMHQKLTDTPRILSPSAGSNSCCIFKVPQSFGEVNGGRYYQPEIVSVGPFHYGDPRLKMIEEHKWRFLAALLKRTQTKGLKLENLLEAIQPLEAEARACYSKAIDLSIPEFIELLVLDGCFVIELFRKYSDLVAFEDDDPFRSLSWVGPLLLRDLIRLENQIPFSILKRLFDLTQIPGKKSDRSLSFLILDVFNCTPPKSEEFINRFENFSGKHILDLLRATFIITEDPDGYVYDNQPRKTNPSGTHVVHCISKLRRAGIQLHHRKQESESFLDVKFKRGTIQMPAITIDDFMRSFLLNCVAYEQCYRDCSKHMTTYATLLDFLINTPRDVGYFCDRKILQNYLGSDAELARFINNLGKDVSLDIESCYLSQLFKDVNDYYTNSWHEQWVTFKYTYFKTPWSFISAVAALLLLVLTATQTLYSVLAFVRPR